MFITYWLLLIGSALFSFVAVALVLFLLKRYSVLDIPNSRSNHTSPVPRGAGIGLLCVIIPIISALSSIDNSWDYTPPLLISALVLSGLSFIDDVRSLPVFIRLFSQVIAVYFGVMVAYQGLSEPVLFSSLPLPVEKLLVGVAWIWFINLYNFMDGIDGITACETFFIALGIIILSIFIGLVPSFLPYWAAVIAGAAVGFYGLNKYPAKIFIGDSGSILLGYFLGYLLLALTLNGQLLYALLISLYYLLDSTITLSKRLFRGDKIWHAHSEHYYQQAVRSGLAHSNAVLTIAVLNSFLVLLAGIAAYQPQYLVYCFAMGIALCSLVLNWFSTYKQD